jgi:hypothetical protein
MAAVGGGPIFAASGRPAGPATPSQPSVEAEPATDPIRPPAVPLVVRGPYVSTWLSATRLPGAWPAFWNGRPTEMTGIVRIDGTCYVFAGAPSFAAPAGGSRASNRTRIGQLSQSLLEVTPTRSRFYLEGGGVRLTVEFLSPVEPGYLRAQSIPMSYVLVTARSLHGKRHDIQIYMDISGSWVGGSGTEPINWQSTRLSSPDGDLQTWVMSQRQPQPLTEQGQFAAWGNVIWATHQAHGLTHQAGGDVAVRSQFVRHGRLVNGNGVTDRAAARDQLAFAFAFDLGKVGAAPVTMPLFIGQVRTPAVSYLGQDLQPLWTSYFPSWQEMLSFFSRDMPRARRAATVLDSRITADAMAAGGRRYAGLCAIALRQAYGGTELVVSPAGQPWAFLKELSSSGNVSTVDVIYPASPAWLYADPGYLGMLIEPLLSYAETGGWPKTYAEHDLGSAYPNATGHNNGVEENMPVEECGNLLIMAAAYLKRQPAAASAFTAAHYQILKQWADYLGSVLPDPGYQNQTDDFAGHIAHSVNLACKGIVAVAAMGQIAAIAGNEADQTYYAGLAKQYIAFWLAHAIDPDGQHLDLTYSGSDGGDGTWGTVYNAYADRLLGTNLIPPSIGAKQAAWYRKNTRAFGLPLQTPHRYAKSDWEMLTAAWLSDRPIKDDLIRHVYDYANTTPDRVPFSDLYDTVTGKQVNFRARPVQGGVFALLALQATES